MADTRVVLPACPCPMRARLRRLAPSYTFTGCLLPQAYGKSDTARNEDEYRVQASPTTPAKLLMLTQGMGRLKGRDRLGRVWLGSSLPPTLRLRTSPAGRPRLSSSSNMSCHLDREHIAGRA